MLTAEVQKRAAGALQEGRDIVIQSQTGSGKTLAFLLPLLSALQYPPQLYPEDLKVPSMQDEQKIMNLHNLMVVG